MSSIVDRILEGNYIQPAGGLEFSSSKIDFELNCDCDYEASFHIYANNEGDTEGVVSATDGRMEILNSKISGTDTEICFHFHGDLCSPGERIKGAFNIISNRGEYLIPFNINVVGAGVDSSMGPVKDIIAFANLARSNWYEALDLFYSERFLTVLQSAEDNVKLVYEALSEDVGNAQNLEEFLISTGLKQKTSFITSKKEITINLNVREYSDNLLEREIEIIRNGWGFSNLRIKYEGDFLFTERSTLSDEDFKGNICYLKIFVDSHKCHKGKNEGKIVFYNNFVEFSIPIDVRSSFDLTVRRLARTRSLLLTQVTRNYIDYNLDRIGRVEFIDLEGRAIEQLVNMDDSDILAKLLQASLLSMEGRNNEASWLVDKAADLIEQSERMGQDDAEEIARLQAYNWFISFMIKGDREFAKVAAGKVEALYNRHKNNWQIAVIASHLPTTFTSSSFTKWKLLEDAFNYGGRSPILFCEALKVINDNPSVLRELNGFSLQVVFFGAKNRFIESKCFDQIMSLVSREKNSSPLLYRTLVLLYDDYKDIAVVSALCMLLIKSGRRDREAAVWYRKGIDAELKINGLFEYYVQSINLKEETDIPVMVLMYFSYQNDLDYERQAYLYHYMIDHRNDIPDIYDSNRSNIESFALNQLQKGRICDDLAAIYDFIINPEMLTRQMAISMADILFANRVEYQPGKYKKLLVYRKECREPWEYSISGGECVVPVFGSAYTIVFEDEEGNRYIDSANYEANKLMRAGKYLKPVSDLVWDNERLNLYLVGSGDVAVTVTKENISRFMQLAESDILRKSVRQETLIKCIEFYSISEDIDAQDRCLARLDLNELSTSQKDKLFLPLIKLGRIDIIDEWVRKYGPYFTSPSNIKRYLEKILAPHYEGVMIKTEKHIVMSAYYVFEAGNPGSLITGYLAQNYHGTSREMRDIWNTLGAYDMPRNAIDKRILSQIIITGAFIPEKIDIAKEYIVQNPDSDLSRAVAIQNCLGYFADKEKTDEAIINYIFHLHIKGETLPRAAKLAFLKYYAAEQSKMNDEIREVVLEFLKEMIDERVYLGFFKEYLNTGVFSNEVLYRKLETILEELEDRTIVDYKAKPGMTAKIHYIIGRDQSGNEDYLVENMNEVCGGVYFKDFVLFFGETLDYYITEERGEEACLGTNGALSFNDVNTLRGRCKYEIINEMIVSNTVKDYVRFDNLIDEYYEKEYLNSELFRMM